jgi:hypothetical protein
MVELPTPHLPATPAEPLDPRVTYYVRAGAHTTEIASSEDWWMLDQYLYQPSRDRLEVWACDQLDAAYQIHPSVSDAGDELLSRKLGAARPEPAELLTIDDGDERELFAPEYHPGYTVAQAKRDFERRYREAIGEAPTPITPDGPARPAREFDPWRDVT